MPIQFDVNDRASMLIVMAGQKLATGRLVWGTDNMCVIPGYEHVSRFDTWPDEVVMYFELSQDAEEEQIGRAHV